MKRPDSADPVLLTITEDLPPEKFDPLYIRPRGRASPKRLVLRHRPSTARAGTRMSPNDAGQRADVHRVEARIVDEAGCRAVRSLVFSSTASRKERIYRPPQRPVALRVAPDEEPGVVSGPVGARGLQRLLGIGAVHLDVGLMVDFTDLLKRPSSWPARSVSIIYSSSTLRNSCNTRHYIPRLRTPQLHRRLPKRPCSGSHADKLICG